MRSGALNVGLMKTDN